jgi:hypothetical protein
MPRRGCTGGDDSGGLAGFLPTQISPEPLFTVARTFCDADRVNAASAAGLHQTLPVFVDIESASASVNFDGYSACRECPDEICQAGFANRRLPIEMERSGRDYRIDKQDATGKMPTSGRIEQLLHLPHRGHLPTDDVSIWPRFRFGMTQPEQPPGDWPP